MVQMKLYCLGSPKSIKTLTKSSHFMCFIGRDILHEIQDSLSHQHKRETMRYSPVRQSVNNGKNRVHHHVKTRPLSIIGIVVYQVKFNVTNFRFRVFMHFRVADLYNKILIHCVLRKQYVL